jgi:hypothetical protein
MAYRLLVMIGFQLVMLFAGVVWATPQPVQTDGVAFKLARANKPVVAGVNAASKRQNSAQYASPLGDIYDDCTDD